LNTYNFTSYLDTLETASRVAFPLMDTVRAFESSGLQQALKAIEQRDGAMQAALKQLGELQSVGNLIAESPLLREMERTQEAMAAFESRFRLPDMAEAARLMDAVQSSPLSGTLARFAEESSSLQRAIEEMRTPWLDAQDVLRSVSGFAELHGIGHALENMRAFDDNLAEALRTSLGDWRAPISWQPEIFSDLSLRSDFYAELGFNHALTALPAPAFEETLNISGLRRQPPPLIVRYEPPVPSPDDDEQEEGFARANTAHDWLQRLETQLRAFIDEKMTRAFGVDWARHRLPNGLYDQWIEKKRKARQASGAERPLIAYADFTDYTAVICRGDNWREVFEPFFGRRESVRECFQRLHPIRLDTMHSRPITQDDELLLYVEARRLVKLILDE